MKSLAFVSKNVYSGTMYIVKTCPVVVCVADWLQACHLTPITFFWFDLGVLVVVTMLAQNICLFSSVPKCRVVKQLTYFLKGVRINILYIKKETSSRKERNTGGILLIFITNIIYDKIHLFIIHLMRVLPTFYLNAYTNVHIISSA